MYYSGFLKYRIAVFADVEAMFYQVRLKPEDLDAVRFLLKNNPESSADPEHYQMLFHIFGGTDSPCCSSFALKRTILDQKVQYPAKIIETLLRDFYMDDLMTSVFHEEEGKLLISGADNITTNQCFNLTKYNSNSPKVLSRPKWQNGEEIIY